MSDWIEWKGGECPVAGRDIVEVMFRDQSTCEDAADTFYWKKDAGDDDIVAYRSVIPLQLGPKLAAAEKMYEALKDIQLEYHHLIGCSSSKGQHRANERACAALSAWEALK